MTHAEVAAAKIRAALKAGRVQARARPVPLARGMNKLEAEYAQQLELRKRAGEIQHWAFEGMRIRLAGGAFYRPDFFVLGASGEVEFHEVKGFQREAALVRIKVAASQHPWFRFVTVRKVGGKWESREVGT